MCFNPLPTDKILDWTKFKAFVDVKINGAQKIKLGRDRIENILGKGENAITSIFFFSQKCFQKRPFSGSSKVRIVW